MLSSSPDKNMILLIFTIILSIIFLIFWLHPAYQFFYLKEKSTFDFWQRFDLIFWNSTTIVLLISIAIQIYFFIRTLIPKDQNQRRMSFLHKDYVQVAAQNSGNSPNMQARHSYCGVPGIYSPTRNLSTIPESESMELQRLVKMVRTSYPVNNDHNNSNANKKSNGATRRASVGF